MTREEAKEFIAQSVKSDVDMAKVADAIKALEQEPCDDAISRQAIDEIKELMTDINGDTVYAVRMSDIRQLPSVKPQEPKTEKVIKMRDATPEERKSIEKYVKSISKLTGVDFWNLDQEPKTGYWRHYESMLICSVCGTEFYDDIMEYCGDDVPKCCPNCGAKMERSDKK